MVELNQLEDAVTSIEYLNQTVLIENYSPRDWEVSKWLAKSRNPDQIFPLSVLNTLTKD